MSPKLDYKKLHKPLYTAPVGRVVRVEVPPLRYLMIDGEGDPNTSPAYRQAVECLFTVSYSIKFAVKKGALQTDYGVMPLEGLWWADDHTAFTADRMVDWKWTMMVLQPDIVEDTVIAEAIESVRRKKQLPALDLLRVEMLNEGACAQTMHVGPFSEEGPTIARVHDFIATSGAALRGKHHEIYLTDIRKAVPAKWRTILRQPMTS